MAGCEFIQIVARDLLFVERSQELSLQIADHNLIGHVTQETKLGLVWQVRKLEQPVVRSGCGHLNEGIEL